jgi:hypothetical protein
MPDYGGKNFRQSGNRQFQFIELTNMEEACGADNAGHPKYNVCLRLVDLDAIPDKEQARAKESCGFDGMPETDLAIAEMCDSYGCHAPLGQWNGNNARKLLRQAYREANSLLNPDALGNKLDCPVNQIGSTAREFMAGDIYSAMQRGCESGDASARLLAKMHGVTQQAIDDTRPDDFLPYVMGYMAGLNGGVKETDPDTAQEYFRGFERGEKVKAGLCVAPSWIKTPA